MTRDKDRGSAPAVVGWRVSAVMRRAETAAIEAALAPFADAVLIEDVDGGEDAPSATVRVTVQCVGAAGADDRAVAAHDLFLRNAARLLALPATPAPIHDDDWQGRALAGFAPFRIGRFSIYGSHAPALPGGLALAVDAGAAFGSGRHETTQGCLTTLEGLARSPRAVRRALDVGTGSSILALAMARLWPRAQVLGIDDDPLAVATAAATVRANALARRVAIRAHRFGVASHAPSPSFDLVCANIRARPLIAMAPALARTVRHGAPLILSGLLVGEQAQLVAAFRQAGFRLTRRIVLDDWATLLLTRRAARWHKARDD